MAGIIFGAKRGDNLCDNASELDYVVRRQRAENIEGKTKKWQLHLQNTIVAVVGTSLKVVCGGAEWRGK